MRDSTPTGSATGSLPKTRTKPLSARSRPRRCLMSVVLPAPFAPTRPYTAPRGRDRLTERSAVLSPKRRVSSETWMTESGVGLLLLADREQVLLSADVKHAVGDRGR